MFTSISAGVGGCYYSLDWNTGLDYWTGIFLVFAHSLVGFTKSC